MKKTIIKAISLGLIFLSGLCLAENNVIKHQLDVVLDPQTHQIQVADKITLPAGTPRNIEFFLHRSLEPHSTDKSIRIEQRASPENALEKRYRIALPKGVNTFGITYSGQIYHPLEAYGEEQSRGYRSTPGLIGDEGVFLAASSYWYPQFIGQARLQFTLNTTLPEGWKAVSQGERIKIGTSQGKATSSWHSPSPQEDVYLIAADFTEYSRQSGDVKAQVFLRQADEKLANKYLDATAKYIKMYEALLGPYPYSKFALVENFWETGYGMPSFTLLGSRVIRLPFILYSSYPHEILHNWWGNGVYVDFSSGNWSEGLTAYLADHLIKQQRGQAVAYRQQSLQKYGDYAANNRDFPLNQFRGRHSSASEAVGYGKTLMFMHMLRLDLGDKPFTRALQGFYQQHVFKQASFDDLRVAFEQASGKSLVDIFDQWVNRTGAPELKLYDSEVEPCASEYCLFFNLQQTQPGAAYQLQIPIAVTLTGQKQAQQSVLTMQQKQQAYKIVLPARPERVDIDPEFDLFRKLAQEETPPAFTQLFGAQRMLVVLPTKAGDKMKKAWQSFAGDLSRMGPDKVDIIWDSALEKLPEDQAVTVLGWENLHANSVMGATTQYGTSIQLAHLNIAEQTIPRSNHAIALVTRFNRMPRAFIAADLAASLPGMGRKLPHYHKYSYLAFSGEEPVNQLKGRWPVIQSPMTAFFTNNVARGKLANRDALISPLAEFGPK